MVGIFAYFVFMVPFVQRRKAESRKRVIEKICTDIAIREADQFEELKNNPYLPGIKEKLPRIQEDIKNREFQECVEQMTSLPIEGK